MLRCHCPRADRKPSLVLLAAATALAFSALHMVLPILPILMRRFDAGAAPVQLVAGLFLAGIAAGSAVLRAALRPLRPPSGADRRARGLSRRHAAVRRGVVAAGTDRRARLAGLGACAGVVLGPRHHCSTCTTATRRPAVWRIIMMAMTVAPGISPTIGAYLAEWLDWRAIFAVLGVLGAAILAAAVLRLPETQPNAGAVRPRRYGAVAIARCCARRNISPSR